MIKPLDRDSEQYHPTGNIAAEGMGNQLGRPALERLAVLVREAVQNSWDARQSEEVPVRFAMHGWTLRSDQLKTLRDVVLRTRPFGPSAELFERVLAPEAEVRVLLIRDSGTSGLGGPTRANEVPLPNVPTDFVDFVRNIGQAPDKALGAGTYGYGKAVLYRSSELSTICIYSRCRNGGPATSRFIACALGTHFDIREGLERGRYTGRHWWGRRAEDGVVDPLSGDEADVLAASLGIPPFGAGETGTSILIVAPLFGERMPEEAMRFMGGCLLWHCWPKMLSRESGQPGMMFSVKWEGQEFTLPDPRATAPLSGFAEARTAMAVARAGGEPVEPFQVVTIRCGNPRRDLGLLVLYRFGCRPWPETQVASAEAAPFSGPSHHVAFMRNAELVVKYFEGPANPVSEIEYSGVFVPFEDVDGAFAKSEPPTHDDWSPQELDAGNDKTFVRVALKRIREAVFEFVVPHPLHVSDVQQAPLGGFADFLGGLVPGLDGTGPDVPPPPPPRGGGRQGRGGGVRTPNPKVRVSGSAALRMVLGTPVLCFPFEFAHAPDSRGTRISATAIVGVLDDSTVESDPPDGAAMPRIMGWQSPDGSLRPPSNQIEVDAEHGGAWQVLIQALPDAVVGVDLAAEAIR